jgi:signal transduction histidine kinase
VSTEGRSYVSPRSLEKTDGFQNSNNEQKTWLRVGLYACLIILAYYASARVGLILAFGHSNVTPVWPPSGIAVAALLIFGRRYWPALAVAAFLVNLTTGLSAPIALILATGNTLEYVIAVLLLVRYGFDEEFQSLRDLILLIILGAIASPLVAATMGTAGLWLGGVIPPSTVLTVWPLYWIGDGMGILVVTPFILVWRHARFSHLSPARWVEVVALAISITLAADTVFLQGSVLPYVLFPLAIWAELRFAQLGATMTVLAISAVAVWGTVHGLGPFQQGVTTERMTNLELYLAAFTLTTLALGALVLARRNAARIIIAHTVQLENLNEELDAFAYTVSHDLRAPLRAIDAFARILVTDYAKQLEPEAKEYLELVVNNAQQMDHLIQSLLAFSKTSQVELNKEMVDVGILISRIIEVLSTTDETVEQIIHVSELPPVKADPELLRQVFVNLLTNAIKFTAKKPDAKIDISYLRKDGKNVYFIKDNGVGFDEIYANKIFDIFQRLNTAEQYEGTGAGLAIVQRIIKRHGGQIWAEAQIDKGATFFFTLS